jgi:LPS export ABC transporter protein LptC
MVPKVEDKLMNYKSLNIKYCRCKTWILPIITFIILLNATCCTEKKIHQFQKPYKGPLMVLTNINALVSDSGQPQILITAPQQLEYEDGNRYFNKGIKIDFYSVDTTQKPSRLTAKKCKYNKAKNIYTVTDNVVIQNHIEHKRLDTEVLHWDPTKHKIYTDKFVKITTPEELLTGTGLESNEDFSSYKILKVSGIFPLE